MNYFARSFLYLSSIHLVLSQQVVSTDNTCYTSNGRPGICKTQQQCLASQSSSASSSKVELFSETCRIDTDGTPVVCCTITADSTPFQPEDNDTYTYVEQESSGSSQGSSNSSDIESRFFNGPRKRQYYNYNVIPQYEPISYNDVYSYQNKKPNDVNNIQNYNSFAYESPANQYKPTSNNNFNNYNYNSYNNPSRNPTSRPTPTNNNPQSWQSSQTTRRPTAQQTNVIFKQTGSASSRLSTATNRYNPNSDYWGTSQTTRRSDIQPIWGEVPESTTTTRVIRTPRPTESYQTNQNQNQNIYRPAQNQNQNNQNQNNQNQNQYPNNQNQYPNNQNQYPNNQNQNQNNQNRYPNNQSNQNQQNQNVNRPPQTQQKRISEQKCNEYAKLVTQKVSAVPLSINSQVSTVEVVDCPSEAIDLIVGGIPATLGEFPHMAALGFRRGSAIEYNCGGTLISEEHVLTAAHCIKSALGDPIHVKLGDLNLEKENDGAEPQIIGVSQIFVHPNYKSPQLYHDIAIIKLSRRVYFNKMLRPACLYPVKEITSQKALATGWGSTNYGETASDDLLKVVLNIIDNRQCSSLYGTDTKLKNGITEDMVCAGELSGKRDTCQGDSGGPLQITSPTHKCVYYVIGITSFGRSCGVPNSAGIYTRVSQYIDWIESVVWN